MPVGVANDKSSTSLDPVPCKAEILAAKKSTDNESRLGTAYETEDSESERGSDRSTAFTDVTAADLQENRIRSAMLLKSHAKIRDRRK
jgi:hypothetical protein